MMDPLDCSVDYERFYSLPFGVAPSTLSAAELEIYFEGLGATCESLAFVKPAGSTTSDPPDDDPVTPQWKKSEWLRAQTVQNTGDNFVLSISTKVDTGVPWKIAAAQGNSDSIMKKAAGSVVRWDQDLDKTCGLSVPMYTDQSLVVYWQDVSTVPPPPQGQQLSGVLQIDGTLSVTGQPKYLLSTPPQTWQGELTQRLLRAPAFSFVRFERYRHLAKTGGSQVDLRNPSNVGRLLVHVPTLEDAQPNPSKNVDIHNEQWIVIENVVRSSVISYFSALLAYQLNLFSGSLGSSQKQASRSITQAAMSAHFAILFRTWFAYLSKFDSIPPELTDTAAFLKSHKKVSPPKMATIVASVAASSSGQSKLLAYLINAYVPIVCGGTWKELGLDAATSDDDLKALPTNTGTWLICFAGCPIGAPARVYLNGPPTTNFKPADVIHSGFTAFEVETLILAGKAADILGAAGSPPPDINQSVDLSAFSSKAVGNMAVVRLVELHTFQTAYGRVQQFTTEDWLHALIKGTTKRVYEDPQVSFDPYAAAKDANNQPIPRRRHPLAELLNWETFQKARGVRATCDQAATDSADNSQTKLALASLNWWIARTNVKDQQGNWPSVGLVFVPAEGRNVAITKREAPTPNSPYMKFTVTNELANRLSGFDYFDFEAVQRANRAVRSGVDFQSSVPLSLGIGLMEREGYRQAILVQREGDFADPLPGKAQRFFGEWLTLDQIEKDFNLKNTFNRTFSRVNWLFYPFGSDQLNFPVPHVPLNLKPTQHYIDATRTQFDAVHDKLTGLGILDAASLPLQLLRDYVENALELLWTDSGKTKVRVLSRRTQWIGLALQLGVFEFIHSLVCQGIANPWDPDQTPFILLPEFSGGQLPDPGPDANSAQRCRFLAYYSLVYLAFNTSAGTWNRWVNSATAEINRHPGAPAQEMISRVLLLFKNRNPTSQNEQVPHQEVPEPSLAGEAPGSRLLGQRGQLLRFAAGLDAFLRLQDDGTVDTVDPQARTANPDWKLSWE